MQLASNLIFWGGKRTPTAKDYVQSGLVAMWDGIENVGWGVHDASATTWVDLSRNGYNIIIPSVGATWGVDSVTLSNVSLSRQLPETSRENFTIECVASKGAGSTIGALVWMKNPSWIGGALVGWTTYGACYYPWSEIARLNVSQLSAISLNWKPGSQACVQNGVTVATASGGIDSRNVLSELIVGEYNGSKNENTICSCVRLYSRALTADEIARNYAIDKARFGLP